MNKQEIIIIRKPCQRLGKRAVLRLDLKVDRVAVCLGEERELVPGRRAKRSKWIGHTPDARYREHLCSSWKDKCDPPARNESLVHFLGAVTFRKGVPYIYQFWLFNEISLYGRFYIRKIHLLHTHKQFLNVFSKCLKQATPSIKAIWWKLYSAISQNDTFWC